MITYKPENYDQYGEAKVLISTFHDCLRYTPKMGWLVYDGKKWTVGDLKRHGMENVARKVQELVDLQAIEIEELKTYKSAKEEHQEVQKYDKFITRMRKGGKMAVLKCAQGALQIPYEEVDKNPYLLNTPDCTVDLRTGEKLPHNGADLITLITSASPSDEGKEKWQQALNRWYSSDEKLIEKVQIICGRALIGATTSNPLFKKNSGSLWSETTFWSAVMDVLSHEVESGYAWVFHDLVQKDMCRIYNLPFNKHREINEANFDWNLRHKMVNEAAPAIMQWLIDGAVKVYSAAD